MKKRLLLSVSLAFATIVAMGQAVNVRITAFDLRDAGGNSLILGFNAANATGVLNNASATPAVLDFIYKAGTNLSKVTLVTTVNAGTDPTGGQIVNPPADFSAPLQLKTQSGIESPYSYCLYSVSPRQLTPVELPATMDLASTFSSDTKGWAAARLDQKNPSINGKGTAAIGFPAANVFTLLSFSNAPDCLYFKAASAATTNGNVLDVYESVDGIIWNASPTKTYKDADGTLPIVSAVPADPFSVKLNPSTRFVKFLLSARSSGNFYVFEISATANQNSSVPNVSVATATVFAQNGWLNIISNENISNLEIVTISGQAIVKVSNPTNQVNIANLPSGCYIVKLKHTDGRTSSCKFIK
jgi:hypothetical protein